MRTTLAATVSCILCASLAAAQHAAAAIRQETQISAQSLASALEQFASDRSLQLVYATDEVNNLRSDGAAGNLNAAEALAQLLQGTGLAYQFLDDNTITVMPLASASAGSSVGSLRSRLRLAQVGAAGEVSASQEAAEDSSQTPQRQSIDEIVVTGSRIAGAEAQGSSPVITFTREEIEKTGANTVQQLLNYLPQASVNNDASGSQVFQSATTVRLRGLPTGTTLVLINGRRAVISGALFTANIFNLNNIPLSAVERVEVLTDSASAVYGADALAGVVNIILRKGLKETTLGYEYSSVSGDDAGSNRYFATTGFEQGGFSGTFLVEAYQQDQLANSQIDRVANADYRRFGGPDRRMGFTYPGNIYAIPGTGNLPGLDATFAAIPRGTTGVGLTPADFAATAGTLNLGGYFGLDGGNVLNDLDRISGMARLDYRVSPRLRLFAEVLGNKSDETDRGAYLLLGSFGVTTIPASNAFNPFGTDVLIDLQVPDSAPSSLDSRYTRVLAGAGGDLGSWDWEAAVLHTTDELHLREESGFDQPALQARLADSNPNTALNLFVGGPLSRDVFADVTLPQSVTDYESTATQVDAQLRGACGTLPAGPVDCVFGGEAREERLRSTQSVTNTFAHDRDRTVQSFFAEAMVPLLSESMNIPFVDRLTLTAAVRSDDYSDFGRSTNPQFGLKWTVSPVALIRYSHGKSFRAPSLTQLDPNGNRNDFFVIDPARGGEIYQAPGISSGRANLQPESGESDNLGLVITPPTATRIELSVDFWRVDQSQRILRPTLDTVLAFENLFADQIERAAPSAEDIAAGQPGRVTLFRSQFTNFGEARLRGVDLRASVQGQIAALKVTSTLGATHVDKYDAAVLPGQPIENRAGVAYEDGYAPKWKATWINSVSLGRWEASVGARYVHSYEDYPDPSGERTVSAQTLIDLGVSYTVPKSAGFWSEGLRAALVVVNALDREPPYSNFFLGYDSLQADILGRQFRLNVAKSF